jgi:hypothetical protein
MKTKYTKRELTGFAIGIAAGIIIYKIVMRLLS